MQSPELELPGSAAPSEWGGKDVWAGEEEWVPPLHLSLRPEWDAVKDEGAEVGRVLGKRGREGFEGERPARRARTEGGMRSVVGRA
ncbi:hypothetical protein IMZ48_14255 [Candidatus Bathyarchaeota archaeon]|nr:hypothetical protein [Candidatus Bathyarchaeota archaeon]